MLLKKVVYVTQFVRDQRQISSDETICRSLTRADPDGPDGRAAAVTRRRGQPSPV